MEKFKSCKGSNNGTTSQFLFNNDTKATEPSTGDDFSVDSTDMLDYLYANSTRGNIYLNDIMISATHAIRPTVIEASHLFKIWRIGLDSAKRTLEVTSQHIRRSNNPTLSRNFETNDRILRYKIMK